LTTLPTAAFETRRDARHLTGLTTDLVVYLDHPMSADRDAVLALVDRFHSLVPKSVFKWYRTETMTKDKPCTPRTFGIPRAWWRDGAERKDTRYLQIRDGEAYNSLPNHALRLSCDELEEGDERPWQPSSVRFVFPASWSSERTSTLLETALFMAETLPVASGHAGLCVERNEYYPEISISPAYRLAMRYQGADIDYRLSDEEFDHLKTINWLTIVGDKLLARVRGRDAVRKSVAGTDIRVHDAKHGLVLQASDRPALGDVNKGDLLPAYRAAYRALAPLFAPAFTPAFGVSESGDDARNEEATEAWYRRFGREATHAR
jgi:Protein of unknown function (DUF3396)